MTHLPDLTDNEPILALEVVRVKEAFRAADQLEASFERFEDIDVPEYTAWHEVHFGERSRLEKLRRRELVKLAFAHNQVVSLAELDNISMRSAWRRYRDEEERYRLGDEPTRAQIDELRRERDARFDIPDEDHEDDDFDSADEDAPGATDGTHSKVRETRTERDDDTLRVHALYRSIVRQLHPDSRDPALRHKKKAKWFDRLWTRTLRARENGDLAEMVVIHGRLLMATRALQTLNLADLRQLTAAIEVVHARRFDETRPLRRNPAWNFSKVKARRALSDELTRDYAARISDLEHKIERLLAIRRGWTRR